MTLHPSTTMKAIAASMLSVLLLSTSACSSSDSTEASAEGSGASAEFTASNDAYLEKIMGKFTETPPSDGPPAVADKTIVIVTITEKDTSAKRALTAMESAAEAIGWKRTTLNANDNLNLANQQLQQAVAQKPDAIILLGLDKTQVGSGMAAAAAANVPVACYACWDLTADDTRGDYMAVQPAYSMFQEMGYAGAAYAFQRTNGSPKFLTFNDASLSNNLAKQQGFDRFMKECKDAGGACDVVKDSPFQVANMTTTLAAQAASTAQANPSFNVVWTGYDTAGLFVMNGIRQAGKATDDSFLVSANGNPESIEIIEEDGYQQATVAWGTDWSGWAMIDDMNRVFAGEPVAENSNVPIRLFDPSNIEDADGGAWSGDLDFEAAYRKTWGV